MKKRKFIQRYTEFENTLDYTNPIYDKEGVKIFKFIKTVQYNKFFDDNKEYVKLFGNSEFERLHFNSSLLRPSYFIVFSKPIKYTTYFSYTKTGSESHTENYMDKYIEKTDINTKSIILYYESNIIRENGYIWNDGKNSGKFIMKYDIFPISIPLNEYTDGGNGMYRKINEIYPNAINTIISDNSFLNNVSKVDYKSYMRFKIKRDQYGFVNRLVDLSKIENETKSAFEIIFNEFEQLIYADIYKLFSTLQNKSYGDIFEEGFNDQLAFIKFLLSDKNKYITSKLDNKVYTILDDTIIKFIEKAMNSYDLFPDYKMLSDSLVDGNSSSTLLDRLKSNDKIQSLIKTHIKNNPSKIKEYKNMMNDSTYKELEHYEGLGNIGLF